MKFIICISFFSYQIQHLWSVGTVVNTLWTLLILTLILRRWLLLYYPFHRWGNWGTQLRWAELGLQLRYTSFLDVFGGSGSNLPDRAGPQHWSLGQDNYQTAQATEMSLNFTTGHSSHAGAATTAVGMNLLLMLVFRRQERGGSPASSCFIPGFSRLDSPGCFALSPQEWYIPLASFWPSSHLGPALDTPRSSYSEPSSMQTGSAALTQVVFHFWELLLVQPLEFLYLNPQPADLWEDRRLTKRIWEPAANRAQKLQLSLWVNVTCWVKGQAAWSLLASPRWVPVS